MLRGVLRTQLRAGARPARRSFVSTVLLTKSWESETVAALREEAKNRGLSSSGNKATLVTRLKQDDESRSMMPPPLSTSPQVRYASSAPAEPPKVAPEHETEVPGVPSTAAPSPPHASYSMDIELPDTYVVAPETPVQIPFVPDFWDSSSAKGPAQSLSSGPKMLTVAGEATHPGGGPSHNLYTDSSSSSSSSSGTPSGPPAFIPSDGVLGDMAQDLGLATVSLTKSGGTHEEGYRSRPLNEEETKGLWVLLGALAGSWLAAGYFALPSAWAHKAEATAEHVKEKAKGKKH